MACKEGGEYCRASRSLLQSAEKPRMPLVTKKSCAPRLSSEHSPFEKPDAISGILVCGYRLARDACLAPSFNRRSRQFQELKIDHHHLANLLAEQSIQASYIAVYDAVRRCGPSMLRSRVTGRMSGVVLSLR